LAAEASVGGALAAEAAALVPEPVVSAEAKPEPVAGVATAGGAAAASSKRERRRQRRRSRPHGRAR
jgi:hypothetical protein